MSRRWVPLAAVVALLGAAMLAAAFANPRIERLPIQSPSFDQPQPDNDVPIRSAVAQSAVPGLPSAAIPSWITWVVTALCAAAVLTVIALMFWYYFRDHLPGRRVSITVDTAAPPMINQTKRRMRDAVEEGLADLDDADSDPRRAVIACWVRLEEAAADAGTPREPGDTSTDLVARLLSAHQVSAEVLADFASLYRGARFAPHIVDAGMRDQARSALRRLRDELAAELAPAAVAPPTGEAAP